MEVPSIIKTWVDSDGVTVYTVQYKDGSTCDMTVQQYDYLKASAQAVLDLDSKASAVSQPEETPVPAEPARNITESPDLRDGYVPEEGYEGIGFSIPINTALPILDDLMQHGRVTGRAQLGITVVEVGSNEANYYGIPAGLRIMSINEDSDVGRQGAEVGDIITSIDGWAITSRADCSDILAQHKPGDTVEISLYRASRTGRGQTFTITVTLLGS